VELVLGAWKAVQTTQPEFVASHVYFDALVLEYLSSHMGAFGPNFPGFRAIRLGTSETNRKTDMKLQIKIFGLSHQI
jgi:hypothetical protein